MEEVIAINATKADKIPIRGNVFPISNPKTSVAPIKPNKTPIHCFKVTSSPNIGPLRIFVKIGCSPTINADKVAERPTE